MKNKKKVGMHIGYLGFVIVILTAPCQILVFSLSQWFDSIWYQFWFLDQMDVASAWSRTWICVLVALMERKLTLCFKCVTSTA